MMSFYVKKSIRVGPLRFNLSKSGIGVSGGVKGFRAGTGPRGNYVHMGRKGLYYRKSISNNTSSPRTNNRPPKLLGKPASQNRDHTPMQEIDSTDVSAMLHSSSLELLHEIETKRRITRIGPLVLTASIILLFFALFYGLHNILILLLVAGFGVGVFYAYRRDTIRKTTVLLYDFSDEMEKTYANFYNTLLTLKQCSRCWHVSASAKVHDKKYNAGASKLVNRYPTTIAVSAPRFVKTNIPTVSVHVGSQVLYFFPDRLLIRDSKGKIGAVGYEELKLDVSQNQFVENSPSSVPHDATVVDHTWKYVNKNGQPDRRFNDNSQLPICLYEDLHFTSHSGLNEMIQISRSNIGKYIAQGIQTLAEHTHIQTEPTEEDRAKGSSAQPA